MKKSLLSMFALCAMFTFVAPAAAQIDNGDGSFTYRIRGNGNAGGLHDDFVLVRYYEEGSSYYNYYRQWMAADYMLSISNSYYFYTSPSYTWAPQVYGRDCTLTFECLDEDYVIKSIGFYTYTYGNSNFTITADNGQSFAVYSPDAGYGEDVLVTNINNSTCTLTIAGAEEDGSGVTSFFILDNEGGDVYKMDEEGTVSGITVVEASSVVGIKDVKAEKLQDNRIFDVQGREVLNPTKGMYIQNGKKFLVK